ncbi:DoxX family protein [Gracilibacillus kekensis]|uniref:Uncharacterized membrane protein n=1 Tax=Gracilibacillus kekensis TaxID=1027249 RepID=A0A1M7P1X0_9BACI|nr:hypothetical protein [Gracilibacillus kekensis]SHN10410.1 Uncharacterized membrane protein [Gracilibacillus kekensis]
MKIFFRILYSILLFGAGVLHFLRERDFRRIVPKALPFRRAIVLITGIFEMIFSITLWVKKGQHITSKLLALFMIAIFPANIYMTVKRISFRPWLELVMENFS